MRGGNVRFLLFLALFSNAGATPSQRRRYKLRGNRHKRRGRRKNCYEFHGVPSLWYERNAPRATCLLR